MLTNLSKSEPAGIPLPLTFMKQLRNPNNCPVLIHLGELPSMLRSNGLIHRPNIVSLQTREEPNTILVHLRHGKTPPLLFSSIDGYTETAPAVDVFSASVLSISSWTKCLLADGTWPRLLTPSRANVSTQTSNPWLLYNRLASPGPR